MYLVTLSYYAAGYNPSSFLQKLQKCVKRRFCWGECTDLNSPLESSVVSQISSINLMICESLQHFTSMVLCRSVTINSCWIRRSGSWWSLVHKVEVCFYPVLDTDSKDVWENASTPDLKRPRSNPAQSPAPLHEGLSDVCTHRRHVWAEFVFFGLNQDLRGRLKESDVDKEQQKVSQWLNIKRVRPNLLHER